MFFTLTVIVLIWLKKITLNSFENKKKLYLSIFVCIIIYTFLQIKVSKYFYMYFPGANFIQFPWRLLSYSTVLSILALCISINIFINHVQKVWLQKLALLILYFSAAYQILFGLTIPINYEIMSRNYIDDSMKKEVLLFAEQPSEYMPQSGRVPERAQALIQTNKACKIVNEFPDGISKKIIDAPFIKLEVEGNCIITYNQFVNPFTQISFSNNGKVESSKESTYLLHMDSKNGAIEIKRMGLINSLITYFKE